MTAASPRFSPSTLASAASLIIKRGGDRADEVKRQRGEKSSRISEDRP